MAEEENEDQQELLNSFLESNFSSKSYRGPSKDYMESDLRQNKYKKLAPPEIFANAAFEITHKLREGIKHHF
jgi:hypothetical protein